MSLAMIPILIGIFILFFNRKEYTQQTLNNNEIMLTQVQSLMDLNFYDIRIIIENLSDSEELANYCAVITEEPPLRSYAKMHLREQLADCTRKNSYIQSIYLYFWDNGEFVTDTTAARGDVIYSTYHNNQKMSYSEWLEILNKKYSGTSIALPISENKTTLAYMKTLPSTGLIDIPITIVTLIDQKKLTDMANSISSKSGCHWNIMANTSQFSLNPTEIMEAASQELEFYRDPENIIRFDAVGNNTLSIISSDTLDVVYWMQTPPAVYQKALRTINMLFLVGLFLIMIGCIAFTAVFVSRNYSPIEQLLQLVPQWNPNGSDERKDEYTAIIESFTSTKIASAQLEEQLSRQDALLLDATLSLMLRQSPVKNDPESFARLSEAFPYPYVTLLILRSSPGNRFTQEEEDGMQHFMQQLGHNICTSEITGVFHLLKLEDHFLLLLNTDSELYAFLNEKLPSITQQLNRWAAENQIAPPLLSLSRSRKGISYIAECYEEAEYDLQYQAVFGIGLEKGQEEAEKLRAQENIYYSSEEESKLIGALLSGNSKKSQEILQQIWEYNLETMEISKPYLYCLLCQLTGTLLRAANLLPNTRGIERSLREAVQKFQRSDLTEHAYLALEMLMLDVCSLYDKEHVHASHRLKNDVLGYIDEHYDDVNLSVESLCNIFGKSRTYLFSLFKEDTGFSLMYHITRVRIENAKKLLRETDQTIQDIAQQVGFNSAMSFTRAFKKYENLAPSKYREYNQKSVSKT